jgi:MinD superfamily P-loop ATPase
MQIAVASGKGGTGKTTVATNLAWVAARAGRSVAYVDCDVEEPNGHIFLRPDITQRTAVGRLVPRVKADTCAHCGLCGAICQFSAIVPVGEQVLVYPELCHSCGGCMAVCPRDAIDEVEHEIGLVEVGRAGAMHFARGLLNVGQPMSPPLIKAVKATRCRADLTIVDVPPGTSCPVIEAVRGADLVLLVTEPTPFGLHDLKLAFELVRALELPLGVVMNRSSVNGEKTRQYCDAQRIPILQEFPDDRRVAEAYARGELVSQSLPQYETMFWDLLERTFVMA